MPLRDRWKKLTGIRRENRREGEKYTEKEREAEKD